jgi:hypothetical protein
VIAPGGGDDTSRRHLAQQQIGEGAARLERARMLEQLELEGKRHTIEAEIGAREAQQRGLADVGLDQPVGLRDPRRIDGPFSLVHGNRVSRGGHGKPVASS